MKKGKAENGSSDNGDVALTIGTFDGVHLGHQLLLDKTRKIAEKRGMESAAYTYEVPPKRHLLGSEPPLIMDPESKLNILRRNVDRVVVGDFLGVKDYSPKRYVEEILVGRLNVDAVIVGNEWRFGRDRSGSHRELEELSKGRFTVHPQKQVKKRGRPVSSTWIRQAIEEGDIDLATELLGRYPSYSGKVIKGHQVGGELGFPTANIEIDERVALPREGNYAALVSLEGDRIDAAVHTGNRPTFGEDKNRQIEVHLLDYEGNLYGRRLEVSLVKFLGSTEEYETEEKLRRAIGSYVTEAREVLSEISTVNSRQQ
jgi:riboflavin kinase/FMN adenylyltransferase